MSDEHQHDLFASMPGARVQSEINVTPLVDVCLVLLIIFMVVTPMLQKGVDVDLPSAGKPETLPEDEDQITMAIRTDGTIWIGDKMVPKEEVIERLSGIYKAKPSRDVVLKGQRDLRYRQVREVMKMINESGFTEVGLVVASQAALASSLSGEE